PTASAPNKTINSTTPSHVENGAGDCTCCRICSVSAILVHQFQRFDEPRVPHRKERSLSDNAQKSESKRGAHGDERHKIPQAHVNTGPVQCGQHNQVHVQQLHEHNPAGDVTKLVRMFL